MKENLTPILGLRASERMQLLTINRSQLAMDTVNLISLQDKSDLILAYPGVFSNGVGLLPGEQHLETDPVVAPRANPVRRVPCSVMEDLKKELARLEEQGIIAKVKQPTNWESSLVTARKDYGKLRVCIDPQHLNKALKREGYLMPTLDDVLPELHGARLFSVADLRSRYWHVKLDAASSLLTTFNTPFGRFWWCRLPFGLSVSSEIFQRHLHQALDGLDGVRCVADDIIIIGTGDNEEEATKKHDERLRALLDRCQQRSIKLNPEKMQLRTTSIKFLGHIVTSGGLKADPMKIAAIKDMVAPDGVTSLKRFLGLAQYLAKFLPRLSQVTEPLRQLTEESVPWRWGKAEQEAFEMVKELATKHPVLTYYDPSKELEVHCDASDYGLGAALMQAGQPICYSSRALRDAERRYAPIEKEMLAVVWATEKYHQYTYGRKTVVFSDHKPLERIMVKAMKDVPKRLQSMRLRLQQYDIEVRYRPGGKQFVPDTLSRAPLRENETADQSIENVNVTAEVLIGENLVDALVQATREDPAMKYLKHTIEAGWPEDKRGLHDTVKPYWPFRDELGISGELVYRGERLVVPRSMRRRLMEEVHSSHLGIQSCLRRARESMYWPAMSSQITDFVARCEICQAFPNKAQQKEPLIPVEAPQRPWQQVSCDIFQWSSCNYLISVDHHSNFFEVDRLTTMSTEQVRKKLKQHFARYGQPEILITDNGPQFKSEEFAHFSRTWNFKHRTSSPYHQQGNGRAEAAVKIAKQLMTKAAADKKDPGKALLAYRNTPQNDLRTSPAQRFLGRRTRTSLPATPALLEADAANLCRTEELTKKAQSVKASYDKRTRPLPPIPKCGV